jgi:hypothetical protein
MTCVLVVSTAKSVFAQTCEPPPWVPAMRETRQRFSGKPGTLALFGDSISVSLAFWAPLSSSPRGLSPELQADLKLVNSHIDPACWREWRGAEFGNEGGMTIRWADENVDAWLKTLNPEAAVILFGTNDLTAVGKEEFEEKLTRVVQRCLANGTVVILTTLPPRHGLVERSAEFAEAVRTVSRDLKVPLIDYHAEILIRRPQDWDGALEQFRDSPGDEYNVPTLIARDGVHPSNPRDHQDYSEQSLSRNGYALRSALTLSRYAEVIRKVLRREG